MIAPFSLAQFDNLAQKTRLSRLVVQRTHVRPSRNGMTARVNDQRRNFGTPINFQVHQALGNLARLEDFEVGVHRCSCGYPPSPRGGPTLWETLKVATFAIPQSHSVNCKAERVRPGKCGNDTPIVPSASWRRSKTVTRNGRRTSPRRRGTSRLTAGTSGVRCCASKTLVGISRLYPCTARRHTPEL